MHRGNSIRVHVREKVGILLLVGVFLAAWGCGDDCDHDTESLCGLPLGRSATPSPAGSETGHDLPTSGTARPTPTMGTPPTRTQTRIPATTPIPQAAIQVGTAMGLPGETVLVDVTLTWVESGVEIAGTQNTISFDPLVQFAARANGGPDCAVNPEAHKGGAAFAYWPSGCEVGIDCTAVHSLVLAFDDVDAIEPGSVLYTCRVTISPEAAPGTYPLVCSNEGASDPGAHAIPLTCDDGEVMVGEPTGTVVTSTPTPTATEPTPTQTSTRPTPTWGPYGTPPPHAIIQVGTATGLPGQLVPVDVTLAWVGSGVEIRGTQNDISFDSLAPIAGEEQGAPDCVRSPDIADTATSFVFGALPCRFDGCPCSGDDCTGIRALVIAFDNLDPIPEGSVLYTCNVAISPEAEPGSVFPLRCSFALASDPDGNQLALGCDDGQILVGSE